MKIGALFKKEKTMLGQSNLVASDAGMKILYRGTLNTLMGITEAGLKKVNTSGNPQAENNTTLDSSIQGILSGQVLEIKGDGIVGAADSTNDGTAPVVGLAVNNAVGYDYESMSGAASEKAPYIHGTGSVVAVDVYETVEIDGSTGIDYAAGDKLYASQNGLLTNASGLDTVGAGATVVGIVLVAPSASNPFMYVQLSV
jgi:hypothetical protein